MAQRMDGTENPYIEDVLESYSSLPNLTMMALGSSYWGPPEAALKLLEKDLSSREVQRYGSILGLPSLQEKIRENLLSKGFDTVGLDIIITSGANQAFASIALAICDPCDVAALVCPFNPKSLFPDWTSLEELISTRRPKMVVLTTPSNPGGLVWDKASISRLLAMCKIAGSWVVVDQVYHEFLHDSAVHTFPRSQDFDYDKIIHIFSFSKSFGIPGWRVGYALFPPSLLLSFRKIQDTTVTHASIISQKLAIHCMDVDSHHYEENSVSWVAQTVSTLAEVRAALWPILKPLGTVYTTGAFYFLVPVPPKVTEEEAVDILAREHGVLLMPGTPFGAPNFMRLSYGGLPPDAAVSAVQRLSAGFDQIIKLAASR